MSPSESRARLVIAAARPMLGTTVDSHAWRRPGLSEYCKVRGDERNLPLGGSGLVEARGKYEQGIRSVRSVGQSVVRSAAVQNVVSVSASSRSGSVASRDGNRRRISTS